MKHLKSCVKGITCELHLTEAEKACSACLYSKMIQVQNKDLTLQTIKHLKWVYSDVWELYWEVNLSRNRYFVFFSDKFSWYSEIFLLKKRTDIYNIFKIWRLKAEKKIDEKLQIFQFDSAEKYRKLICDWISREVKFEFITSYISEQNRFSECLNCTITESLCSMLYDVQMLMKFWEEAVKTVNYLQNCLSLRDKWGVKTSYELYKKFKLSVEHLRLFRCVVHTHISKKRWVKLKNMFYREVFIDYCKSNEQFQIWNPSIEMVEIQTHLIFIEHEKGDYLLTNSEQYNENWEALINSNTVDDDYSSVLTPQNSAWRCTESEKALSVDFDIIKSVREVSEPSMRIQRLGSDNKNWDKDPQMSLKNTENYEKAHNSDSKAFRTIHIDTRLVRETLKSVEKASTEKTSWYEWILRLNSQYVNMTIQKQIHEPFTYKEAMRSLTYHHQWAQVIEEEGRIGFFDLKWNMRIGWTA